jgi:hypothetical protein
MLIGNHIDNVDLMLSIWCERARFETLHCRNIAAMKLICAFMRITMQSEWHIRECLRLVRVFTIGKIFYFNVGLHSIKFLCLFSCFPHKGNGEGKLEMDTILTTLTYCCQYGVNSAVRKSSIVEIGLRRNAFDSLSVS